MEHLRGKLGYIEQVMSEAVYLKMHKIVGLKPQMVVILIFLTKCVINSNLTVKQEALRLKKAEYLPADETAPQYFTF